MSQPSDSPALRPITEVARDAGIPEDKLHPYGRYKAKVSLDLLEELRDRPEGKLVLVTSINPTAAGEGKTVTSIGLTEGLWRLGHRAGVTLREPSMGPTFGMKGGATGAGRAAVEPSDDINFHFTGDFHAITSANNLLSSLIDNHLYRGNPLGFDVRRIAFQRVLDMNDRSLRRVVVGLQDGVPRQEEFQITAASEIMAIMGLASDYEDLKARLGRIVAGFTRGREPITADALDAPGAMAAILRDALMPNLVQTSEGTPAFVHGGPFANIAHGTSSVAATRLARRLFDITVIEAGFGADLGAEKYINLVSRHGGVAPDLAVVVASVRALKHHAGARRDELDTPDVRRVKEGLANLDRHLGIIETMGLEPVVAVNRFPTDGEEELQAVIDFCRDRGTAAALSEGFSRGGEGTADLARTVVDKLETAAGRAAPVYDLDMSLEEKIEAVAEKVYGADGVAFSRRARRTLRQAAEQGYGGLPICIAKTQYSLSDNPRLLNSPRGFNVTVRDAAVRAGAGFVVVYMGDIMTMPGLPRVPNAVGMDLLPDGTITGIT